MAIQINCNIKGCLKYMTPLLSSDGQIYCSECGEAQNNPSHFLKAQLKAIGQTKKSTPGAFNVKCNKCKITAFPSIDPVSKKLICPSCRAAHSTIAKPFELLIRQEIDKVLKPSVRKKPRDI